MSLWPIPIVQLSIKAHPELGIVHEDLSTDVFFRRIQVEQISDDVVSVGLHGGNSIIIMEPEFDEIENIIGVLNEKKLKHKKVKEVPHK